MSAHPLTADYGQRFDETEIRDTACRLDLNSVNRTMRAMHTISLLLQASASERFAQEEPECLIPNQEVGLLDALIDLAGNGIIQAENVGIRLIALAKEGGNGNHS
jgi:hypothetical protein